MATSGVTMNEPLKERVRQEEAKHQRNKQQQQQQQQQQLQLQLPRVVPSSSSTSAATGSGTSILEVLPAPAAVPVAANTEDHPDDQRDKEEEEEEEQEQEQEDEEMIARHLLCLPNATWKCLQPTRCSCVALNPSNSLFAVGEKDGRITLWDNVSLRVCVRELDPSSLEMPPQQPAAAPAARSDGSAPIVPNCTTTAVESRKATTKPEDSKETGSSPEKEKKSAQKQDSDVASMDTESVEDDEASVEEASAEDGSADSDDDEDDDRDDDDDDEGDEEQAANHKQEAHEARDDDADTGGESVEEDDASVTTTEPESLLPTVTSSCVWKPRDEMTFEDVFTLRNGLKNVTCCAWNCDSTKLFASCEVKSNSRARKARLLVWDVQKCELISAIAFESMVHVISTHPKDANVFVASRFNAPPVVCDLSNMTIKSLEMPQSSDQNQTHSWYCSTTGRSYPSGCVRYGSSGKWLYGVFSKGIVAIFDPETLKCVRSTDQLPHVTFPDVKIDQKEEVLLCTSSKGIHEYNTSDLTEEIGFYHTGAVRVSWFYCGFAHHERFIVGMPLLRHRLIGDQGLYSWDRRNKKMYHDLGVKDGVCGLAWESTRESLLAVSAPGGLFCLEEDFKTGFPGPMYPACFRLISENEPYLKDDDEEDSEIDYEFTLSKVRKQDRVELFAKKAHDIKQYYLPADPIRKSHRQQQTQSQRVNRLESFASVFEPLKNVKQFSALSGFLTTSSKRSRKKRRIR